MHYLLLSALLYALNNFYWKTNLNKLGAISIIWSRAIFTFLYSIVGLFLADVSIEDITDAYTNDGHLYLLAASAGILGLVSMVKGLKGSTLGQLSLFQAALTVISGIGLSNVLMNPSQ